MIMVIRLRKVIKPKSTELVLASIKKGNNTRIQMHKDIQISVSALSRALVYLNSHELITKRFDERYVRYFINGGDKK